VNDEKVIALIKLHMERYPALDVLDVYRLLHQSIFGPGHAIKSQKAEKEWLERQTEILGEGTLTPFVENIHPGGEVVRLYLRPYIAARGNPNKLLEAYTKSASNVKGNLDTMTQWWDIFQRSSSAGEPFDGRFDVRNITLIARTRKRENWPASPHSPAYEANYKPVYRVLTLPLAQTLLDKQKIPFDVI
jgi:hypothetical protein